MTSTIKVNNVQNQCGQNIINENSNTITIGASGDTIALASGASQTGFGRTGTVDWQTTPKTTTFTAVNGEGYFVNTSGGAVTANLPAGSAGAIVSFADYTRTFQTNNLTITPNGSEKIGGVAANFVAQTEGQSITLIYVDGTEGWINTAESTGQAGLNPAFITATGGTITTVCTDYKVHTFTGPGTFTVCSVGNPLGSNTVDYLVVAGGGGGAGTGNPSTSDAGGGGGAGGFREGYNPGSYTASPLATTALPVTATAFPITVGGGGSAGGIGASGTNGSNSIFSTITSAGGGFGKYNGGPGSRTGGSGGSGGGPSGGGTGMSGGAGNTPPTSPSQGFPGSIHCGSPDSYGGAGGGATQAGFDRATPTDAGPGGAGATSSINATPTTRAGGGGGGGNSSTVGGSGGPGGGGAGGNGGGTGVAGTTNTGGGGGGGGGNNGPGGGAGGSGIVIIRYKFQ